MTATYTVAGANAAPSLDLCNPAHFEHFVVAHSDVVRAACLRLLKDRPAAEDACQETFIAAWRYRQWLRPNRAWLLKVATNKCLDELRRRSRHRGRLIGLEVDEELVDRTPTQERVVLDAQTTEMLEAALLALPSAQRIAVVLSDVEGWGYRNIARACGVPEGTVKSRIFRARRLLRRFLEDAHFFE